MLKILAISPVQRTYEIADIINTVDEIYLFVLKKKTGTHVVQ